MFFVLFCLYCNLCFNFVSIHITITKNKRKTKITWDKKNCWQGWSNGGKNQNPNKSIELQTKPNKIPDQNLTPQKSHAKFPSDKNFSSFAELCGWAHAGTITNLRAPVVQTLNSTIYGINHYPRVWETNCTIQWIEIYPSHSAIHRLNNRGQIVLNIQKNPYLNQATPQKILYFPTKKNPSIIPVTSNLEYPPWVFRLPLYQRHSVLSSTLYDLWYDNNVLYFLQNHITNTQDWD